MNRTRCMACHERHATTDEEVQCRLKTPVCRHSLLPWTCQTCLLARLHAEVEARAITRAALEQAEDVLRLLHAAALAEAADLVRATGLGDDDTDAAAEALRVRGIQYQRHADALYQPMAAAIRALREGKEPSNG